MVKMTMADVTAAQDNRDIATLLDRSPAFRRFVFTIMFDAGIFEPTYRQGSPSATSDFAYSEGRRALGLEVLHSLKHARPDVLALLEQEGELLAQTAKSVQRHANRHQDAAIPQEEPDDDY